MNAHTERLLLPGPAGTIEVARDVPTGAPSRGVAVIAHPHPLFGGTLDNKVVQTLARAFVHAGWTALRFNFRGVGASSGTHDEGRGELQDLLAVVQQLAPPAPGGLPAQDGLPAQPLALAGFSFGAFVTSHALAALWHERPIAHAVLVGTATTRFAVAPVPSEAHLRTLVLHGEQDDVVPLASVFDWARPQALPVTVIPGGGHFFHGQLPLLKSLVLRHLRATADDA